MVILGINFRDPFDVVVDFVETFGPTFPILWDESGDVYMSYANNGQSPFPLDYVIDQDGIIRYVATEYNPDEIIQVIEELLGLAEPEPLTISCLLLENHVPEGGYIRFETTFMNNTESDIAPDGYELHIQHYAHTSCAILDTPVFTHTIEPGTVLPPGPTTIELAIGPLPEGIIELNPMATKISCVLLDPEPIVTDDCCFSWRILEHPAHRDASPAP